MEKRRYIRRDESARPLRFDPSRNEECLERLLSPLGAVRVPWLRTEVVSLPIGTALGSHSRSVAEVLLKNAKQGESQAVVPEGADGVFVRGIDAASVAAVEALRIRQGDHFLDLCAAPGSKFLLAAERAALGPSQAIGTATGVDASPRRADLFSSVVRGCGRYSAVRSVSRVFSADGAVFSAGPPRVRKVDLGGKVCLVGKGRDKKGRKRKKRGEKNDGCVVRGWALAEDDDNDDDEEEEEGTNGTYDRVLVDAECTADASVRPGVPVAVKPSPWSGEPLFRLQSSLLASGVSLASPNGGIVVYSTCTLDPRQNEAVVECVLAQKPECDKNNVRLDASLAEEASASGWPCEPSQRLPGCVYFDPEKSGTSGMFIARLIVGKEEEKEEREQE